MHFRFCLLQQLVVHQQIQIEFLPPRASHSSLRHKYIKTMVHCDESLVGDHRRLGIPQGGRIYLDLKMNSNKPDTSIVCEISRS